MPCTLRLVMFDLINHMIHITANCFNQIIKEFDLILCCDWAGWGRNSEQSESLLNIVCFHRFKPD